MYRYLPGHSSGKRARKRLVVNAVVGDPVSYTHLQRFEVQVRYAGSPAPRNSRWGRVGWEELDDGILVAAQPVGAPTWFPCNDRPSDKATYRIAIELEDAYAVIAPGDLRSHVRSSGRGTWTFDEDIPTATYLVALHIGRYRRAPLPLGSVPGAVHYLSLIHI